MKEKKELPKKPAPQDLQTDFLEKLRLENTPISCFLVNGVRLSGSIHAADQYTVLITNNRGGTAPQLVNKSAISTICPDIRG